MGHEWLKTNSAGSGPFKLRAWKPNESVALDANPDYWRGAPKFKRVVTRHIPEPATQRLLLEKGDIDIARKLSPEDLAAVAPEPGHQGHQVAQGHDLVSGPEPEEPEPRQARGARGDEVAGRLRRASSSTILKGSAQNPPGVPARGLPGRHRRHALQARRRQGQGAAGQGRAARRLQGHHGHPQQLADQGHRPGDPGDHGRRPASRSRSSRPTTSRP